MKGFLNPPPYRQDKLQPKDFTGEPGRFTTNLTMGILLVRPIWVLIQDEIGPEQKGSFSW